MSIQPDMFHTFTYTAAQVYMLMIYTFLVSQLNGKIHNPIVDTLCVGSLCERVLVPNLSPEHHSRRNVKKANHII